MNSSAPAVKYTSINSLCDVTQFLYRRFSGFRFVESRAGLPPDMRVADSHDIRAAILCEFGVDATVAIVDGGANIDVFIPEKLAAKIEVRDRENDNG